MSVRKLKAASPTRVAVSPRPTPLLPFTPSAHSTSIATVEPLRTLIQPIEIDWQHLIDRRPIALKHAADLPEYLLYPEIRALLNSIYHAQSRLLFETLWHSGARITEALGLCRHSFDLDGPDPYLSLDTLKKRGRPKKSSTRKPARMVPIRDPHYIDLLRTYFTTHTPRADEPLFPITRQAAGLRLRTIVQDFEATHGALPIRISPHTFRHSFAVHCVLHGRPLPVIQNWMGHADIASTLVYTRVLAAETGHLMAGVVF